MRSPAAPFRKGVPVDTAAIFGLLISAVVVMFMILWASVYHRSVFRTLIFSALGCFAAYHVFTFVLMIGPYDLTPR